MANLSRDEIVVEARRILGKTDAAKGGAADTVYYGLINRSIGDLCRDGQALKSEFNLSTVANDKHVPILDEILWIEELWFVPPGGQPSPMTLRDGAVLPTFAGVPTDWWWTAVNVPDILGPSVRTISIHPFTSTSMSKVLFMKVYQKAKDLSIGSDTPEIHQLFHETIAVRVAWYMMPMYREKMYLGPWLEKEWMNGVEKFKEFCYPARKMAVKTYETMGYTRFLRNSVGRFGRTGRTR